MGLRWGNIFCMVVPLETNQNFYWFGMGSTTWIFTSNLFLMCFLPRARWHHGVSGLCQVCLQSEDHNTGATAPWLHPWEATNVFLKKVAGWAQARTVLCWRFSMLRHPCLGEEPFALVGWLQWLDRCRYHHSGAWSNNSWCIQGQNLRMVMHVCLLKCIAHV